MQHDALCELNKKNWRPVCQVDGCRIYLPAGGHHCHCGSRAFPLCEGCAGGQHLKHRPTDRQETCECDLCEEAA